MNFILIQLILQFALLWSVHDHLIMIGDECKVPTYAYKFPAISREFTSKDMVKTYGLRVQIEICIKAQKEMFRGFIDRFTYQTLEKLYLRATKGSPSPCRGVKKKDQIKPMRDMYS